MEVPINRSGEISKSGLPLESALKANQDLTLPFDVTKIIFSGLSEEDLLNTIKVSTEWKKASLELSKNEYKSIEAFVNWIAPKLGEVQKAKLAEVMESTTILESINLAKIKLSTQELLQQILSIVGGLNKEEISNLETLVKTEHKPSFFDTLLKLAIIEHDLEDASKIEYTYVQIDAFEKISNRLTALGQYDNPRGCLKSCIKRSHKKCN